MLFPWDDNNADKDGMVNVVTPRLLLRSRVKDHFYTSLCYLA